MGLYYGLEFKNNKKHEYDDMTMEEVLDDLLEADLAIDQFSGSYWAEQYRKRKKPLE